MDRAELICALRAIAQQVSDLAQMMEGPGNDLPVLEAIRAIQVQLEQGKVSMLEGYLLECAGGAMATGDCQEGIEAMCEAIHSASTFLSVPHWRALNGENIPDPQHVL